MTHTLWDLYFPAWFREPIDRLASANESKRRERARQNQWIRDQQKRQQKQQQLVRSFLRQKTFDFDVEEVEWPDDDLSVAAHHRHIVLVKHTEFKRVWDEIEAMNEDLQAWSRCVECEQEDRFRPQSKYTPPRPPPSVCGGFGTSGAPEEQEEHKYTVRNDEQYRQLVKELEGIGYWQHTWEGGLQLVYAGCWCYSFSKYEIFDDDKERDGRYDKQMTKEYRTVVS